MRLNDGPCLDYVGYQIGEEEDPYYHDFLWPLQSFSCSFNITDSFHMEKPGIYSIKYELGDAVITPLETTLSVGWSHEVRKRNVWSPWFAIHWGLPPSETIYMEKLAEPIWEKDLKSENLHIDLFDL